MSPICAIEYEAEEMIGELVAAVRAAEQDRTPQ
jgi:hypothetical protein